VFVGFGVARSLLNEAGNSGRYARRRCTLIFSHRLASAKAGQLDSSLVERAPGGSLSLYHSKYFAIDRANDRKAGARFVDFLSQAGRKIDKQSCRNLPTTFLQSFLQ
jgi:hypothetical protein